MNYRFSGHETFHCRPIWLKKGYDYARSERLFNEDEAVVELGVGKNMVTSIKFWLRAFGFYDLYKNELIGLADSLLGDKGFDPFLEDEATLYLLHYLLVKNVEISSLYNLAFVKFSKEKIEFTPETLTRFVERECLIADVDFNDKTLKNDIKVFLKTYVPSDENNVGDEDNLSGLFYDLRLIQKISRSNYKFNINTGKFLPEAVFLYAILDTFENEVSIHAEAIRDRVSTIFLMEKQGTQNMIERIVEKYPEITTFKKDGGRNELQIREKADKLELLKNYYEG